MRSCKEITELVSKGLDKKLGLGERLAISMHVMLCSRCRNFQIQVQFIRKAARRYIDQLQNHPGKNS
ncbi:MAG: zf-HC2 domain-containing protein [Methylomonas sp.]|nr:zf-HC2 domain-containing protein [Methylomonas sp.]